MTTQQSQQLQQIIAKATELGVLFCDLPESLTNSQELNKAWELLVRFKYELTKAKRKVETGEEKPIWETSPSAAIFADVLAKEHQERTKI
ncbi:MAG: hypothetical protein F6K31_15790 [Symploca sp. SIO2G7]|nr:hypothetical protein [Symploca sp. SIO2G7]